MERISTPRWAKCSCYFQKVRFVVDADQSALYFFHTASYFSDDGREWVYLIDFAPGSDLMNSNFSNTFIKRIKDAVVVHFQSKFPFVFTLQCLVPMSIAVLTKPIHFTAYSPGYCRIQTP